MAPPVVSHVQIAPLLAAHRAGEPRAALSLDLGRTSVEADLGDDGIRLPAGGRIPWPDAARIVEAENACFRLTPDGPDPIRTFSETTGRVVGLMPTVGAPTMLLGGFYMHRVKGTDPWADTEAKIAAAAPVRGRVLDTTMGLGYTAIAAARTASQVVTIEFDPAVVEIAALNPWSEPLFSDPKIERRLGDAAEVVPSLDAGAFDHVVHDPPTMSLAGQLYSGDFYRQLLRVLRPGGRLFHYIGRPDSGYGARTGAGVVRRLREAGFTAIAERPAAFGFVATRPARDGRRR
jgi:hypothetical protein